MKRSFVILLFVVAVAAGVTAPGTLLAGPENSVNLGFGGVPRIMKHCKANVYIVEYEHMLNSKIAVLGRGSGVDYKFDDGEYVEQGSPRGFDIGARYYPSGGMKGFFIGGTVGFWSTDWTFSHARGRPNEVLGTGNNDSLRANVDIGARFPVGSSSLSIMPSLNIGRFYASSSCEYTAPASRVGTTCRQESEVKAYVFLAVTAGIGF